MENNRLSNPKIIYFKYNDGTIIRSRCSTNPKYFLEAGIPYKKNTAIDIDYGVPVPDKLFDKVYKHYNNEEEDVDCRNYLDKFLDEFIKRGWK